LIVLHYTAMETADLAVERLCAAEFEVSAHYLISDQGTLIQMVETDQRAWHAGVGSWGGLTDINSHSIGIELDNNGRVPFGLAQLETLHGLLADLMAQYFIPPERIIGHSDMAPGRKADPGPQFPWQQLAKAGLSVWAETEERDGPAFDRSAAAFGYPVTPFTLEAFRLRFRPNAQGPEEPADRAMIHALAQAYPVDPNGVWV